MFQNITVSNGKAAHPNVNKLKQRRLLLDRKRTKSKHQVLNVEKLDEITAGLEHSRQKNQTP
jgi:hypothetical protein